MRGSRQRRWWSCGVAKVVDCGLSGDGRKAPVQLVERALLGLELWIGSSVPSELVALERERLDPANELGEFASLAARLELIQVAAGGHRWFLLPKRRVGQMERVGGGAACAAPPPGSRREVERRLFLDDGCRRLTGVPRQERDDASGEHEHGTGHQSTLVPVRRRLGNGVVAAVQQRAGAGGGEGGEDRQAEGGAELLPGVQESGGEPGLVL